MAQSNQADGNTFVDLSGINTTTSHHENPYNALIEACSSASEIQARYAKHRETRNAAQRQKFTDPNFDGVTVDPVLYKLMNPERYPDFSDTRNCLVFWARPPAAVRGLVAHLQQRLQAVAPNLWLMPLPNLHMTALEITFSLTAPEIDALVAQMAPAIPALTDYTHAHRARLVMPQLSYDTAAIALSFVPAAGEDDAYSYHHLRRDLFDLARATGVQVASRYVVPSAHLTVARFVGQEDVSGSEGEVDRGKVERLVECIEGINADLREEWWPPKDGIREGGGQWVVGQEKGLDCRKGVLWYGGGETVRLGKGF
ncbi:MAG: hypothetical protein LQ344_003785 [Seirophora lacunosa]|nr:MAG: hypothetical protein LQ344_003785 [Seirophora lacunosa]